MLRPEVSHARKLRRAMSLPEVILWEQIRGRKLGKRFRRQHPIGPYVVDFCCAEPRVVVELDGAAHDRDGRPQADAARDRFLSDNGYRILRVAAADVLKQIEDVVTAIGAMVAAPLHQPAAGPPPRAGEEPR